MGSKNTAAVYKHVKDTDKHEQAILAALAHWAHDDPPRICWYSINQIANATHYSRNGVIELTGRTFGFNQNEQDSILKETLI